MPRQRNRSQRNGKGTVERKKKKWTRRRPQQKKRQRSIQRRPQEYRRLTFETLEDRRVLAAAMTFGPTLLGTLAGLVDPQADESPFDVLPEGIRPENILETVFEPLPEQVRSETLSIINQLIDAADAATIYHAFPGEANEVEISSDLANSILLVNESPDVTLVNAGIGAIPPIVVDKVLEAVIPDFTLGINVGGSAGPLVAFVEAEGDAEVTITAEQVRSVISSFVDFSSARAMLMNPSALRDFIPSLDGFIDIAGNILDFDVRDVLNPVIDMEPIVDIDLPFGLPDIEIPPDISRNVFDLVDEVNLPTSFNDLLDQLPGELRSVVNIVTDTIDFLSSDLLSDRIFISTLDRGDTISFPNLVGIPVTVYAGTGNDTITAGNGVSFVESIVDPFDFFDLSSFTQDDAAIELYGQGGSDTIVMGLGGNSRNIIVDGGTGNDQLVLQGSGQADIIELEADDNGVLQEIRYFAPDPNGGVSANEVQIVTLPPGTNDGTFTLKYTSLSNNASDTTAGIDFDADGAAVQAALEALSNLDPGDVAVAGPAGGPFVITFTGAQANANQQSLEADGSGLTRTAPNVSVLEVQQGNPDIGVNQVQRIDLPPNVVSSDPSEPPYINGGTFTLTFEGDTTEDIEFNASGARIREALEALDMLNPGDVSVTGGPGGPWFVEFTGDLAVTEPGFTPPPLITAAGADLTGGVTSTLTTPTPGVALQATVTLPTDLPAGQTLGGEFTLSVDGVATAPLPFNASASQIREALENLPNANDVSVIGAFGGPWDITLSGSGADGGITGDPAALTGGVVLSVNESDPTAVNETQKIEITGATGGTFQITIDNGTIARTTGDLPFDATADEVQTALEALGSVGVNNVIVTSPATSEWDITFTGDLSGTNLDDSATIVVDVTNLTGGLPSASVVTETQGVAGDNEIQDIVLSPTPTSGDFTLTFNGETTAPIAFNASAAQVRASLESLASVSSGDITVTKTTGADVTYTVEFVGLQSAVDQDPITGDPSNLTGGFPGVTAGTMIDVNETQSPENEVQTFTFSETPVGGFFQLGFRGERTTNLAAGASAGDVETALEALSVVDDVDVSKSGDSYTVTFVGELAAADLRPLVVDTSDLTRDEPVYVEVSTEASLLNEIQQVSLPPAVSDGTFTLTFQSMMVEETVQGGGGMNEEQTIMLPGGTTGGTFQLGLGNNSTVDLDFDATEAEVEAALAALPAISGDDNIDVSGPDGGPWVVTFKEALADTDVALIQTDSSGLTGSSGAFTTDDIDYDASAEEVRAALQDLVSLGGDTETNVRVTVPEISIVETNRGRAGVNEIQTITLPDNTSEMDGGTFTLSFRGEPTDPIDFDATEGEVESALNALPIADFEVAVTGDDGGPWSVAFTGDAVEMTDVELLTADASNLNLEGGPWTIEFINDFGAKPLESITVDASNVEATGLGDPTVTTDTHGGDGTPILLSTKRFNQFVDVEHLRIEAGDGDDVLRLIGPPTFSLGIMFEAEGGTDTLEIISKDGTPEFVAPIFPDDVAGTVFVDGQAIQFADMEGGLTFDADGSEADVTVTGTDGPNDIRFAGISSGRATFANDGQVTLTLVNFGDDSTVEVNGAQGEDMISIAPGGVTEFAQFTIDGGGPSGADSVRFEGTSGLDSFLYTPSATSAKDGNVTYDLSTDISLDFFDFEQVALIGLGNTDSLLVNEPQDDSDDTVLFLPALADSGSFQTIGGQGASSPVTYQSVETRTFDLGTGTDRFIAKTDDLPSANLNSVIDGGSGTTTVTIAGQLTTFEHDTTDEDSVEIEVVNQIADFDVTPGVGVTVAANSAFGRFLTFNVQDATLTARMEDQRLEQTGFGDVTFKNLERVTLLGGNTSNMLTADGQATGEVSYEPTGPNAGAFSSPGADAAFSFEDFLGDFIIDFSSALDDQVTVEGTRNGDTISASAETRVVTVVDSTGTTLKKVTLGDEVDIAAIDGKAGDDLILVAPDPGVGGELLQFEVDGNQPNASDRLVVQDQGIGNTIRQHRGSDERSGSIFVGLLPPVTYRGIEFVDILPLDPVTGGTGSDGLGRIVVFHPDTFSSNNSFSNPTELPDLFEHTAKPNISPGGKTDPFGLGFDLPGDEDWYRFIATETSTFEFQVVHEPVPTLPNGQPGLPGDGQLRIDMYQSDGTAITRLPFETDPAIQTIGVENGQTYLLRVRGDTPEAINIYDINVVDLDTLGPQIFDPDDTGPEQAVQITGEPEFNLFDTKPADGPTPPVTSLTINIQDLPVRFPGFLYGALDEAIASDSGHYQLVGDHNGIIAITNITAVNDPVIEGEKATATITLEFDEPLPDDRYTLTLRENIPDPNGNLLDGESNANEPNGAPEFPSGDGLSGGDFVARFTVDSRPELATYAGLSVTADINGNQFWDPNELDHTNRDLAFEFGSTSDQRLAGKFDLPNPAGGTFNPAGPGGRFDVLAAYGNSGGDFRLLIDDNLNGAFDAGETNVELGVDGLAVAGNWDGNADNGDEVAIFTGEFSSTHAANTWFLFGLDGTLIDSFASNISGNPIAGDFDGDGNDDLATYQNDRFFFDLADDGLGSTADPSGADATITTLFALGNGERPVAADMDLDGIDDIGLWIPNTETQNDEVAEWRFLRSGFQESEFGTVGTLDHAYSPELLGNDLQAFFGKPNALPLVGNFDPPIANAGLPDVFIVDSVEDSVDVNPGDGLALDASGNTTLRAAIEEANALAGVQSIEFDISGAGPHTIMPLSALPMITDAVIIDGTTEPDFAGTPVVEIDGSQAGGGNGLTIATGGGGSTIRGLAVNRFGGHGLVLAGSDGNTIAGNFIGTDVTGEVDLGNGKTGVFLTGADNNLIGGIAPGDRNVISGNTQQGVRFSTGSTNNTLQGNLIGTAATGSTALANLHGISIVNSPGNVIGGTSEAARNVISGNQRYGVQITGASSSGNRVEGNYIGADATGSVDLGNGFQGVVLATNASSNTIGGTADGAGNVISGNDKNGIFLRGGSNNSIQGNLIGTDATGEVGLGNSLQGIAINGAASGHTIGGTASGAGNVISANGQHGVRISGGSTGIAIMGNLIGTNPAGASDLGNDLNGITIINASSTQIGGSAAGAANVIANNAKDGIALLGGTGNAIRQNSIFANAQLGIDLNNDGVTGNDTGDPDPGPNNSQNTPEISAAALNGSLLIDYLVDSTVANSAYDLTVEFFLADVDSQEGMTFLGEANYPAGSAGAVETATVALGSASEGDDIVATVTDDNGNTSEFSASFTITSAASLLLAARHGGTATGGEAAIASSEVLTTADVEPLLDQAIAGWIAAGISDSQIGRLENLQVGIADLSGARLGEQFGNTILLDVNAAGHGWFIDPTPSDDSEFFSGTQPSTLDSQHHVDLLTVIYHEMGHALGLEDDYSDPDSDDIMNGWLPTGTRRMPSHAAIDFLLADGKELEKLISSAVY